MNATLVDVDEHRGRARRLDPGHGRHAGVRGRDHLVAGADAERPQRELDRVRARRDADRLARAAEGRELLLEGLDARAADEPPLVEDVRDGLRQVVSQLRVLAPQVEKRDAHASAQYRSP